MNFLNLFYTWLIESGRRKKVDGRDVFAGSIGSGTAKGYVSTVRMMMVSLGYVKKIKWGEYSVVSGLNWRKLSVPEIKDYIQGKFPPGKRMSVNEKNRRFRTGIAIKKFAQYMVHGQRSWTEDKLFEIQKICSFSQVDYEDLEIEPPNKSHAFCEWVWEKDISLAVPIFFGQWLGGMRYIEVQEAKVDLKSGSLALNFRSKKATIIGKGAEGKTRYPPFDDLVESKLKEYLQWRKKVDVDSDSLVVVKKWKGTGKAGDRMFAGYGNLPKNSGQYNARIRDLVEQYNLEMEKAGRKDMVMALELCSSHKLGRHVYGTYFGKKLPESQLSKFMGIESEKVLRKYINFSWDEKKDMYSSVTATYLNGGGKPRPKSDVTTALDGIREFAPKGKEGAWNSLVDGLIGLVT